MRLSDPEAYRWRSQAFPSFNTTNMTREIEENVDEMRTDPRCDPAHILLVENALPLQVRALWSITPKQ